MTQKDGTWAFRDPAIVLTNNVEFIRVCLKRGNLKYDPVVLNDFI